MKERESASYVKKQWRESGSGLSLKQWARNQGGPVAGKWLDRKRGSDGA